ncbi:MAG: hypothetical protein AAF554_12390 [Bacteroidota bacterium]
MGFFDWINLTDEFAFNGSIEKLNEKIRLKNEKPFRVEWIEYNKFKFLANSSYGIFMNIGGPITEGISGIASIEETDNDKVKVYLKSKVRFELYLVTIILGLILSVGIVKNDNSSPWVLLLLPFIFFWFWFVYRIQEKALFGNLKKILEEK